MPEPATVDARRLLWAEPLTVAATVLGVLLISMIPDLQIHRRRPDFFTWPRTSVLMGMHVVAWLITVTLLTTLTCSKRAD